MSSLLRPQLLQHLSLVFSVIVLAIDSLPFSALAPAEALLTSRTTELGFDPVLDYNCNRTLIMICARLGNY